jgi:uncharacterized MAPEG superfamily protein
MTIPFICVAIAYLLIFIPRMMVAKAMSQRPEGYNNKDPRLQQRQLDPRGTRAAAAEANGFESFAPFAAAVIICHLGGGNPNVAAAAAVIHIGARAIYPFFYVSGRSSARSAIWMVATAATLALFTLPVDESPLAIAYLRVARPPAATQLLRHTNARVALICALESMERLGSSIILG